MSPPPDAENLGLYSTSRRGILCTHYLVISSFFLWVRFYDSISCFKNLRPQRAKTSSYHPSKPPTIYKKRHHLNSLLRAKDTHGQLPEFGNSWPTDSSYPAIISPAHSPPANSTNAIPCARSIFGTPEKAMTTSPPPAPKRSSRTQRPFVQTSRHFCRVTNCVCPSAPSLPVNKTRLKPPYPQTK